MSGGSTADTRKQVSAFHQRSKEEAQPQGLVRYHPLKSPLQLHYNLDCRHLCILSTPFNSASASASAFCIQSLGPITFLFAHFVLKLEFLLCIMAFTALSTSMGTHLANFLLLASVTCSYLSCPSTTCPSYCFSSIGHDLKFCLGIFATLHALK